MRYEKLMMVCLIAAAVISCALGEGVLVDGWREAATEALISAQSEISNEIRNRTESSDKASVYTGTGDAAIGSVKFKSPTRITIEGNAEISIQINECTSYCYNRDREDYSVSVFSFNGNYPVSMEGTGEWKVTIESLGTTGESSYSGVGPFVSDFFRYDPDDTYHIVMDASALDDIVGVKLSANYGCTHGGDEYWADDAVGCALFDDPVCEGDFSIPITNEGISFWYVDVPDSVSWSITKE